ncbi:LLM class flavin-dependent oxidoreductase [Pigmentiphaga sp. YJ18]|uniref:LLM class flavin-dependent oxidoreductase n=1 Tax=Pigmentiphaga sp. YJ18 TaxID=3134907 RepID=UPI003114E0BB
MSSTSAPLSRAGGLLLAYLHRGAEPSSETAFAGSLLSSLAREIERAGFDLLVLDDEPRVAGAAPRVRIDPFTAASFVATRTRHLGLAVTADAAYYEPFNLARLTASLDHITHGRAALNLVHDPARAAAVNFGVRDRAAPADPARHAREFLHVVRALWDSWEDDAFLRDKASGRFVDGDKVHAIAHRGEHFQVQGPLNVARPPQGQLPLVHVERSPASRPWAAAEADVVVVAAGDEGGVREAAQSLRALAVREGRAANPPLALAPIVPWVADTPDEAQRLRARVSARPDAVAVIGTPDEIAATLQAWVVHGVVDGFAVLPAPEAGQWPRFAEQVVPALVRRGAIGPAAAAAAFTLRGRLGLARPANRHASLPQPVNG